MSSCLVSVIRSIQNNFEELKKTTLYCAGHVLGTVRQKKGHIFLGPPFSYDRHNISFFLKKRKNNPVSGYKAAP